MKAPPSIFEKTAPKAPSPTTEPVQAQLIECHDDEGKLQNASPFQKAKRHSSSA
jgi:hypothetical protein